MRNVFVTILLIVGLTTGSLSQQNAQSNNPFNRTLTPGALSLSDIYQEGLNFQVDCSSDTLLNWGLDPEQISRVSLDAVKGVGWSVNATSPNSMVRSEER